MQTQEFLTAHDVSVLLRVTRARVYELIRLGIVPAIRLGRQVRVSSQQLRDWLARGQSIGPIGGQQ
jgi:excisionase family DNA binding protein